MLEEKTLIEAIAIWLEKPESIFSIMHTDKRYFSEPVDLYTIEYCYIYKITEKNIFIKTKSMSKEQPIHIYDIKAIYLVKRTILDKKNIYISKVFIQQHTEKYDKIINEIFGAMISIELYVLLGYLKYIYSHIDSKLVGDMFAFLKAYNFIDENHKITGFSA